MQFGGARLSKTTYCGSEQNRTKAALFGRHGAHVRVRILVVKYYFCQPDFCLNVAVYVCL